jgi:maltose-binding protein MalE
LVDLINDPVITDDPVFSMYSDQIAQYGVPRPRTVKANEIWTAVHSEFQNALLGSSAPDQALDEACAAVEGIIG